MFKTYKFSKIICLFFINLLFIAGYSDLSSQPIRKTLDNTRKNKNTINVSNKRITIESVKAATANLFTKLNPIIGSQKKLSHKAYYFSPVNITKPNIDKLLQNSNAVPAAKIIKNNIFDTPRFMSNIFQTVSQKENAEKLQAKDAAMQFFVDNKNFLKLQAPDKELVISETVIDSEGNKHIRYNQVYQGIPVWGKEITLHLDKSNKVLSMNSIYTPTPEIEIKVEAEDKDKVKDEVAGIAIDDLKKNTRFEDLAPVYKKLLNYKGPDVEKVIWHNDMDGKAHLAYKIEIRPNLISRWRYFIDVNSGAILEKYNTARYDGATTGQGIDLNGVSREVRVFQSNGVYYMYDVSREMFNNNNSENPKGMIITFNNKYSDLSQTTSPEVFYSLNNQWSDPASVSMHYSMGFVYEYFKTTHGRNSLDNMGMNITSVIHVTEEGQGYDNAYWNGQFMVFGDGGELFKPLPGALDVVGHEMTHGVVEFTVGLEYKYQSGALDEAFADWGGAMVDRDNWLIGENIVKPQYYPSGAMRNMEDPHNGGSPSDHYWLPAHMNEYQDLNIENDNGGVHVNCGIINKATALIGNAIGKQKLEEIYYRILDFRYLNKQSQFVDMRIAAVKSATELYGASSAETNAVKAAFDAVGILGDDPTQPDDDLPEVQGQQWIAMVGTDDRKLYVGKSVISNLNTDVSLISESQVSVDNGCVITTPETGEFILFIDSDNKLRMIKPDGTNEQIISEETIWRTISISPNARYIAATTTANDNLIFIMDLQESDVKEIELYIPSTGDEDSYDEPLYANTLSWNVDGRHLAYDAVNYKYKYNGDLLVYMDLNLLDTETGVIYRVFPPMPDGIHLAAPSFGQTSEYPMLFNIYNELSGDYMISAVDLFTGDVGQIASYPESEMVCSSPVYSTDDRKMVFQGYIPNANRYSLFKIPLLENKIQPSGNPEVYLSNAVIPKWFAMGSRPNRVDVFAESDLSISNYPNPFSNHTLISFYSNTDCIVTTDIFDTKGNKIASPVTGKFYNAGKCIIDFNGKDNNGLQLHSGAYLLRLTMSANGKIQTKMKTVLVVR